jgi:hypothetical protein
VHLLPAVPVPVPVRGHLWTLTCPLTCPWPFGTVSVHCRSQKVSFKKKKTKKKGIGCTCCPWSFLFVAVSLSVTIWDGGSGGDLVRRRLQTGRVEFGGWLQRGGMVGALVQPCDAYQSIFNQTSCACHASVTCDSHVIHCRCTVQINIYIVKLDGPVVPTGHVWFTSRTQVRATRIPLF